MTRDQAARFARAVFPVDLAAAAGELLAVAWNPAAGNETGERARGALRHLDPDASPYPRCCSPLRAPAFAASELLMELVLLGDRAERVRVAGLLQALCFEAGRIASKRASAA